MRFSEFEEKNSAPETYAMDLSGSDAIHFETCPTMPRADELVWLGGRLRRRPNGYEQQLDIIPHHQGGHLPAKRQRAESCLPRNRTDAAGHRSSQGPKQRQ